MFSKSEHDLVFVFDENALRGTEKSKPNPNPPVEERKPDLAALASTKSTSSRGNGKPNSKLEKAIVPLGRKNGMASYEPLTDAEQEQERQRQKLALELYLKAGGASKNPIPEASASD